MTKLKITPAEPSVADAEHAVTERTAELRKIKADIAAAEAALPALALDPDDAKFEAKSLEIDRLKRAGLRASARLEPARTALTEAKASAEQTRRQALFDAGVAAAAEVERLVAEYEKRAKAVADIFFAIDSQRAAIEAANDHLPEGEYRINAANYAFEIGTIAKLPAAAEGSEAPWAIDGYGFGKLSLRPTGRIEHFNSTLASASIHPAIAAAAQLRRGTLQGGAQPSGTVKTPLGDFMSAPAVAEIYGDQTLPDGSRKITLPPNEWA
ncbi:MAG: hypothetical protein WDN02_10275 [Methylovirgula sp.]|uniref:hypothetical protein n=1 Tax=Methylovirgula sp. TaxID=1978224 RepID=UPI003075F342